MSTSKPIGRCACAAAYHTKGRLDRALQIGGVPEGPCSPSICGLHITKREYRTRLSEQYTDISDTPVVQMEALV